MQIAELNWTELVYRQDHHPTCESLTACKYFDADSRANKNKEKNNKHASLL
jgi:hypothetical protein